MNIKNIIKENKHWVIGGAAITFGAVHILINEWSDGFNEGYELGMLHAVKLFDDLNLMKDVDECLQTVADKLANC